MHIAIVRPGVGHAIAEHIPLGKARHAPLERGVVRIHARIEVAHAHALARQALIPELVDLHRLQAPGQAAAQRRGGRTHWPHNANRVRRIDRLNLGMRLQTRQPIVVDIAKGDTQAWEVAHRRLASMGHTAALAALQHNRRGQKMIIDLLKIRAAGRQHRHLAMHHQHLAKSVAVELFLQCGF